MKVLVADDDAVIRKLLERVLAKWGYDVAAVDDGQKAWAVLEAEKQVVGIAVLDLNMPGMNGLELCRRIRTVSSVGYLYVILLTGQDRQEDIVAGLEAGADDYVTKPFDAEELRVRIQAGRRVVELERALLAANEQLRVQAMTDSLTGLLNHGAVVTRLDEEVSRAARDGTMLTVCMVDVDHFKRVNDTCGHAVGDQVLAEAAHCISRAVREYDVVGRYGGEEFLVVLPGTDLAGGAAIAERFRRAVADVAFDTSGGQVRVTVSAGVAVADFSDQECGAHQLLRRADQALYRAKAEGRDRVAAAADVPVSG